MQLIRPNWPAPNYIRAFSTTRSGGVSTLPFDSMNLAEHVGDDVNSVVENRQRLQRNINHPINPNWLTQTHSDRVVEYAETSCGVEADGVFSSNKEQVCVVMTADCLPVLLCSRNGDFVAAIHAGWRGLANGILINAVKKYSNPELLMAWIGPAISQQFFEVGSDVRDAFVSTDPKCSNFFIAKNSNKYLADLAAIAEYQLSNLGADVYQSGLCSYQNKQDFFSYRRDGHTGRMASMIWIGGDL